MRVGASTSTRMKSGNPLKRPQDLKHTGEGRSPPSGTGEPQSKGHGVRRQVFCLERIRQQFCVGRNCPQRTRDGTCIKMVQRRDSNCRRSVITNPQATRTRSTQRLRNVRNPLIFIPIGHSISLLNAQRDVRWRRSLHGICAKSGKGSRFVSPTLGGS
jgi:hypothetical protein